MNDGSYRIITFAVAILIINAVLSGDKGVVTALSSVKLSNPAVSSSVKLYDPRTKTEIVLLGCLHGSLSSSIDVQRVLLGEEEKSLGGAVPNLEEEEFSVPDAVVLELCKPRYKDILASRKEIVKDYGNQDFWDDLTLYWLRTLRDNGPIVALLKITLGTTSLVQTNLSGIRAGLEFEVAMDIVEAHNNKHQQHNNNKDNAKNNDISLVMGDQKIDETMNRIGSLPSVSLELLRGSGTDNRFLSSFESIKRESNSLWSSIFGNASLPENSQICMPQVLLRNSQARKDLSRLLFLPSVLATVSTLLLAWIARGFEPDPYDVLLWETLVSPSGDGSTTLSALSTLSLNSLSDFLSLMAGYVLLALPASKVIVSERDDVLTDSIVDTIKVEKAQPGKSSQKIVAILGLLHVNGVAQKLVGRGFGTTTHNNL